MKLAFIAIAAFVAYAVGVGYQQTIVRSHPTIARAFYPPFFQFSESFKTGRFSPFAVGMSDADVVLAANRKGLVQIKCNPGSRITNLDRPPSRCFSSSWSGTYWQLYFERDQLVGARIYTTLNLEI